MNKEVWDWDEDEDELHREETEDAYYETVMRPQIASMLQRIRENERGESINSINSLL